MHSLDRAEARIRTALSESRSEARSAQPLGADIVAIFDEIQTLPNKLGRVYRETASRLDLAPGPPLDPALQRAGTALADLIDADRPAFDRNPYHNRQHYCEVMLTAYFLCLLEQRSRDETQFILLAALVHDFMHDGRPRSPFQLERASVEGARPLLAAAGVGRDTIDRLEVLVLATDPSAGLRFMSDAHRAHRAGNAAPPVPAAAPELGALADDAVLTQLARLLCEADILPSIGLTFAHSLRVQQRLSQEWGRPLAANDKLAFIDRMLACGFLGDFFLPNVQAARHALAESLHAPTAG